MRHEARDQYGGQNTRSLPQQAQSVVSSATSNAGCMLCCRARDDKARQKNPGFDLAIVMSGPVRTSSSEPSGGWEGSKVGGSRSCRNRNHHQPLMFDIRIHRAPTCQTRLFMLRYTRARGYEVIKIRPCCIIPKIECSACWLNPAERLHLALSLTHSHLQSQSWIFSDSRAMQFPPPVDSSRTLNIRTKRWIVSKPPAGTT